MYPENGRRSPHTGVFKAVKLYIILDRYFCKHYRGLLRVDDRFAKTSRAALCSPAIAICRGINGLGRISAGDALAHKLLHQRSFPPKSHMVYMIPYSSLGMLENCTATDRNPLWKFHRTYISSAIPVLESLPRSHTGLRGQTRFERKNQPLISCRSVALILK